VHITRIQVEEGFLHGLDLILGTGLTVIIGARGTGKSSLLELIRFALGSESFTEQAEERGGEQAKAVLATGRVVLTLEHDGEIFEVERSASDPVPAAATRVSHMATILGQNEIEAVAAQPLGRLRLLDRLRPAGMDERSVGGLIPRLSSLTADIRGTLNDIAEVRRRLASLSEVPAQLQAAIAEQAATLSVVEGTRNQDATLQGLQQQASILAMDAEMLSEARKRIDRFSERLHACLSGSIELDPWPSVSTDGDLLADVRVEVQAASDAVQTALRRLGRASSELTKLSGGNQVRRTNLDNQIREIRMALNQILAGEGAVTRRVDELREQQGQLNALSERLELRSSQLEALQSERRELYRAVEAARDARSSSRQSAAEAINSALRPYVKITLRRSARRAQYTVNLVNALRGSGIHYNRLAPDIANVLTPLELVELAERGEVQQLATRVEIAADRAANVVAQLMSTSLGELIASPIDDAADFHLFVGDDYRPTDQLSIGQRCTTVLPILLGLHGRVLGFDQPEDNLDNAYIAETLVARLRTREADDQLLISSHNPNIPVLGEADHVVVLASDGRRGWVDHAGRLDDTATVTAITSLLEGGAEAFARRWAFYESSRRGSSLEP